jgi:hypothetical protein
VKYIGDAYFMTDEIEMKFMNINITRDGIIENEKR